MWVYKLKKLSFPIIKIFFDYLRGQKEKKRKIG
ncbi:Hypothetical protein Minf_0726 [Methylacidiphilum infernorum V4]|uniref:Uncharacterized protein n=1 Tax=Methylacidiphilum infernorum (isolate V4) TaxID=481448 RepID=B3E0M7_METI4|nr:Hypothetical protein Minf_0726 [Methylacidiphilum infernorum V4]